MMDNNKKIGITTPLINNYGSFLQAYALSKVLNSLGYSHEFINIDYLPMRNKIRKKYGFIPFLFFLPYLFFRKFVKKVKYLLIKEYIQKFNINFEIFRKNYLNITKKKYNELNIYELSKTYEIYITGSDQVWNFYNNLFNPIFWLTFVSKEKKKISYAASMGKMKLSYLQKKQIEKALKSFNYISVREKECKLLLNSILNNNFVIEKVLDPTMLIKRTEWDLHIENPIIKEKYVFSYILSNNYQQRKFIKNFCKCYNYKIVTIPYLLGEFRLCDLKYGDIKLLDINPFNFINLIKHAEYIFTDSYHALIFSCIYHKEFFIFKKFNDKNKKSENSRIYSFVETFEISDRIINEKGTVRKLKKVQPINYKKIDYILEREYNRSIKFLKNALLS